MAFLKFGKKKQEDSLDIPAPPLEFQAPPAQVSPVDEALNMKQQGYNNDQIAQNLQSKGFDTNQVHEAINQAGLSAQNTPDMGMPDYGYEQQYPQRPTQAPQETSMSDERIQEVAEAIIDEKWNEFTIDIKKVIEWKEKSEDRIAKIEQQVLDLKLSMDNLTKSMMNKISSYDQNIVNVGTEIKAMEKVFQQVLPNLTESVNKLDRMAKGTKEIKK